MAKSILRSGGKPQVRAIRKDGWTPARQTAFLDHLAATCNVNASARAVGMSNRCLPGLRRSDPVFAARYTAAIEAGYEALEAALLARALGQGQPVDDDAGETVKGRGELPIPDGTAPDFDPHLALRVLSQRGAARPMRRAGRTAYKTVSIEEVEAALTAKLDAMEQQIARTERRA